MDDQTVRDVARGTGITCLVIGGSVALVLFLISVGIILLLFTVCGGGIVRP